MGMTAEHPPIDPSLVPPPEAEAMPPVPPPEAAEQDPNQPIPFLRRVGKAALAGVVGGVAGFAAARGIEFGTDHIPLVPEVDVPGTLEGITAFGTASVAGVRSLARHSKSPREQVSEKIDKTEHKIDVTKDDQRRRRNRIRAVGGIVDHEDNPDEPDPHLPGADPKSGPMQPKQRPRPKRGIAPFHSTALRIEKARGRRRGRKYEVWRKAGEQIDGKLTTEPIDSANPNSEDDYVNSWGLTVKFDALDEEGKPIIITGADGKPRVAKKTVKAGLVLGEFDSQRGKKTGVDTASQAHEDRIEERPELRHRISMWRGLNRAQRAANSLDRSHRSVTKRIEGRDRVGEWRTKRVAKLEAKKEALEREAVRMDEKSREIRERRESADSDT